MLSIEAIAVFAIDPGPCQSSYVQCLFTGDTRLLGTPLQIQSSFEDCPNEKVLEDLKGPIGKHIVCEDIVFYGDFSHVGKTIFDTCRWCGRFEQRLADLGQLLKFMPRQSVKTMVCNNSRAKDPDVRQALIDRFGSPGKKSAPGPLYGVTGHCWQALALAVAYSMQWRDSLRLQKDKPKIDPIQRLPAACAAKAAERTIQTEAIQ